MPRPRVYDRQNSFAGGLNTQADATNLAPNQASNLTNAEVLYPDGTVSQRLGTQRIHTTAIGGGGNNSYIVGLLYWADGGSLLAVTADGHLWTAPLASFTWPVTFTDQGQVLPLVPIRLVSMAAFTDASGPAVYISSATSGVGIAKWNGSTATTLGGVPNNIWKLCVQNQRLFGVDSVTNKLYWSSLNMGDDIGIPGVPGAGGNSAVNTFGESALIGLTPLGSSLLMFHYAGVSAFTGWSQSDIAIASGTASVSADTGMGGFWNSACTGENVGFLMSTHGAFAIVSPTPNGMIRISKPVDNTLQATFDVGGVTGLALHDKARKTVYFFAAVGGGTTAYCYNYDLGAWYGPWSNNSSAPWTGPIYCGTTAFVTGQSNLPPIVLIGGFDGYVRQFAVPGKYKDDILANGTGGTGYSMQLTTRPMVGAGGANMVATANAAGNPVSVKSWRFGYVTGKFQTNTTATAQPQYVGYDNATAGNSQQLLSPGAPPSLKAPSPSAPPVAATQKIQLGSNSQAVQIHITDTTSSGANVYTGVAVEGFDYGNRY